MELAQEMPSWGPLALKLASIAVLSAALATVVAAWRNRRK